MEEHQRERGWHRSTATNILVCHRLSIISLVMPMACNTQSHRNMRKCSLLTDGLQSRRAHFKEHSLHIASILHSMIPTTTVYRSPLLHYSLFPHLLLYQLMAHQSSTMARHALLRSAARSGVTLNPIPAASVPTLDSSITPERIWTKAR